MLWWVSLVRCVQSQCHTQKQVFHAPVSNASIESEKIVPQVLLRDMIHFIILIRGEWWISGQSNLTVTQKNDSSCAYLSSGMKMEDLEGLNSNWSLPIMMDLTLVGEKVFIPGEHMAIVTLDQFSELAELLGFNSRLVGDRHHKVVVRLDTRSFHNYDASTVNSCHMGRLNKTIHHQMVSMLTSLGKLWTKFVKIMYAHGQDDELENLKKCSGTNMLTLESLVHMTDPVFWLCVRPLLNTNTTRVRRGVSLLSEIFGDGSELIRLEGTLSEVIERYNENFKREELFGKQVSQGLKDLDMELNHVLDVEEKMNLKLLQLQLELRHTKNSYNFLMVKMYKLQNLESMLEKSMLMDELDLLDRSVFHRTNCQLDKCEVEIFSERQGDSVWIHRKIVELKPTTRLFISCKAASLTQISVFHSILAEQSIDGTVLVNSSLIKETQLANASFVNKVLRPIHGNEVVLGNFIVYGNWIQCLKEAVFLLNSQKVKCENLESHNLPVEYNIKYKGQEISHHIVTRQGQLLNIKWMENYEEPVDEENFELEITRENEYHPVVNTIFLNSVGEFSIAKVSIFSGGTCLLLLLAFILCFCCCESCRNCVISICSKSCAACYHICTTETCRIKRENKKLRKENKQKRRILERNLQEHRLIDQALSNLELGLKQGTCDRNMGDERMDQDSFQNVDQSSSAHRHTKAGMVVPDKETFL